MDPQVVYAEMMAAKEAAEDMVARVDLSDETFVETLVAEVETLTERLTDLDTWLRKGGFKPREWAGDAPSVRDHTGPHGMAVCGACGAPTESEPCREHQPGAAVTR